MAKMNEISFEEQNKIRRWVDDNVKQAIGKVGWDDVAEKISNHFTLEYERNLAFIYVGFIMGKEKAMQDVVDRVSGIVPDIKDITKKILEGRF